MCIENMYVIIDLCVFCFFLEKDFERIYRVIRVYMELLGIVEILFKGWKDWGLEWLRILFKGIERLEIEEKLE